MTKSKLIISSFIIYLIIATVSVSRSQHQENKEAEHHPLTTIPEIMGHEVQAFTVVGIEYQGTKIWVPGTLIVKKGQKVKITLINNIKSDPNTHGYSIDEFGIKVVVARGEPKTVEFNADKEGLFKIYCQIHPAHIGGQLLVLK